MTRAYKSIEHSDDVIVLGAGGTGLRATLGVVSRPDDCLRQQGANAEPHGSRTRWNSRVHLTTLSNEIEPIPPKVRVD
jgi:hypothetical protein